MIRNRVAMVTASLLILVVSALAAVPAQAASRRAKTPVVSIVTTGPADEGDGILVAFTKYLKKDKVRYNESIITTGANEVRAVVAGKADFGIGTPVDVVLAASNGGSGASQIKYLVSDMQATDYEILAQKHYTLKNLAGATFGGAAPGTSGVVIGHIALKKAGINPTSLQTVEIGDTGARLTALLAGKVDLAPILAPEAIPAAQTGKVKVLLNAGKVIGPFLQQGLFANATFVKQHPKVTQKVVDAMIESGRFANQDEHGYIAMVNSAKLSNGLTNSEERSVYRQLKAAGFFAPNGGVCSTYISKLLNLSFQTGELKRATTPARSNWLDASFVQHFLVAHHQKKNAC